MPAEDVPAQNPSVQIDVDRSRPAPSGQNAISRSAIPLPAAPEHRPWADWMLTQLGDEALAATGADAGVQVMAAANGVGARVVLALQTDSGGQQVLLRIGSMQPGMKRLSVYRLDAAQRWRNGAMVPMEVRETPDREGKHEQRLFLPAGSVALVCLDPVQVRASMES